MKESYKELSALLANTGIRTSYQRIRVLEYLMSHLCHPTADQIYCSLHDRMPALSKSTVYNTLNSFIEAGLVKVVAIENNESRYDIRVKAHGHFKCEACGAIYDFGADIDNIEVKDLDGFQISDKHLYFKGICPRCLDNG